MCAYNAVDGAPACANPKLLGDTLRNAWGFKGSVVSDCAAIADIAQGHKFAADTMAASVAAVKAGTDLSCGKEFATLVDAVHSGLIPEAAIDLSVKRLFTTRFPLGMFDPATAVPFNTIAIDQVDSPSDAELALQAARESLVLLKNARDALPLESSIHTIAVVGPNAATIASLEGNYNGVASHPVTPLATLEQRLPGHIHYAQGSPYVEGAMLPVPQTYLTSDQSGEPGLQAEYFNGEDLSGSPAARRIDRRIDFDWSAAAPLPGISPASFSVRWTGFITPPIAGPIPFAFSLAHCSTCNDAESIHVWLDGDQVYVYDHAATSGRRAPTPPFQLNFKDTRPHALRIEYSHQAPHFGAGLTFQWAPPATALLKAAVDAANQSDLTIAFLGLSPDLEGEEMPIHIEGFNGGDRTSIELPRAQQALVTALAATGKPIVLVLMNGGAIALGDSADKASAILEAWYPGELGGTAIADTLFGDSNPSGRLPVTFYASTSQIPPFQDYSMANRTYRYFTGKPEFSFGYGLSYTGFKYSDGHLSSSRLPAGKPLRLDVHVSNDGPRDGQEIVEVYLRPKDHNLSPKLSLVAFAAVQLSKGASTSVHIEITREELSLATPTGRRIIRDGKYELIVGGGPPDGNGIVLPLQIVGSVPITP
jgi:beta-glucosidase